MKKGLMEFLGVAFLALLSGCLTVRETEYPPVADVHLPEGRECRVQLAGFEATVTTYTPVYGYETITEFGGPWYGPHGRRRSGWNTTTVSTTEFIPQTCRTSEYLDRATDAFERGGCILQTTDPQYRVEVRFDGPYLSAGDGWATAGWMLLTIFTADYGAQCWNAKLKIHDAKSGRLLHEQNYSQRYEVVTWGPIPIFSPAFNEKTSWNLMKNWCLSALKDLVTADALRFLGAL